MIYEYIKIFSSFKITNNNDCWPWLSYTTQGYGYCRLKDRTMKAHRAVWIIYNGEPNPWSLNVDHKCNNRICVNPNHMQLLTSRENTLRGNSACAVNFRKTHCKNGHEFTEDNIYRFPKSAFRRHCKICYKAKRKNQYHEKRSRAN